MSGVDGPVGTTCSKQGDTRNPMEFGKTGAPVSL